MPILELVNHVVPVERESPYLRFAVLVALTLPLSIFIASLLYVNVELPLWARLRSKKKIDLGERAPLEASSSG
jgi:peptidoglycan/LPS O-acetylase OafA/YrhL